jgi:putative ABC transport system substrate-binding protein
MGRIHSGADEQSTAPWLYQEEVCMGKFTSGCMTRRGALRVLGGSALGLAAVALSGCDAKVKDDAGSGGGAAAAIGRPHKGTCKIGVLQLADHAALTNARKGFEQALKLSGMRYKLDVQHGNNDIMFCQGVAGAFAREKCDLAVALGTPALQAVASIEPNMTVVGAAITDLAAAGVANDNQKPGGNVTGAMDLTPVEAQFDLLQRLFPSAKRVGILYCTSESNSEVQASMAEDAASSRNLKATRFSAANADGIAKALRSMVGKVDVCYAPTDNTVALGMKSYAKTATAARLPIICGEAGMVEAGGLATCGYDYAEIGRQAANIVVRIWREGALPGDIPAWQPEEASRKTSTNEATARALGVDLSVLDA